MKTIYNVENRYPPLNGLSFQLYPNLQQEKEKTERNGLVSTLETLDTDIRYLTDDLQMDRSEITFNLTQIECIIF